MHKKAFTLIEVLIAITVFSVGVLAVLNLIMNNLWTLDKIQTKITATLLAKEGIEIAYNIRDSNLQKWFAWDCILKTAEEISASENLGADFDVCEAHFSSGFEDKVLQVGFDPKGYYFAHPVTIESGSFAELFSGNRLSYFTQEINGQKLFRYGYSTTESWAETSFARYLLFTGLVENGKNLPTDKLLKIESHVLYQKGWYHGDIVLESVMGNF